MYFLFHIYLTDQSEISENEYHTATLLTYLSTFRPTHNKGIWWHCCCPHPFWWLVLGHQNVYVRPARTPFHHTRSTLWLLAIHLFF